MHLKNVLNWKKSGNYTRHLFLKLLPPDFFINFHSLIYKIRDRYIVEKYSELKKKLQLHLINSFIGNDFVSQVKILPVG